MIKYVLAALILGVFLGYLNADRMSIINSIWISDYLLNASLVLLLFVMGATFTMDTESISKMRKAGPRILLVPLGVILGTLLGGVVGGLILNMNVITSTAVSAGFGWYTLTGPLITQLFGPKEGALAFTSNFLRELITIVTIPLMVKIDKYAPTASGGATTMDTTLPVIVKYCGSDTLIAAFSSGFVLSLLAPFMILAIASLNGAHFTLL
jgi:uncharacterized membrane protein YbjE (DUF340 family)